MLLSQGGTGRRGGVCFAPADASLEVIEDEHKVRYAFLEMPMVRELELGAGETLQIVAEIVPVVGYCLEEDGFLARISDTL